MNNSQIWRFFIETIKTQGISNFLWDFGGAPFSDTTKPKGVVLDVFAWKSAATIIKMVGLPGLCSAYLRPVLQHWDGRHDPQMHSWLALNWKEGFLASYVNVPSETFRMFVEESALSRADLDSPVRSCTVEAANGNTFASSMPWWRSWAMWWWQKHRPPGVWCFETLKGSKQQTTQQDQTNKASWWF